VFEPLVQRIKRLIVACRHKGHAPHSPFMLPTSNVG
jgi:hypothetical protein